MAEVPVLEDVWINTNYDRTKWIRVDPDTGGLYCYNSGTGQYDVLLPVPMSAITGLQDALDGKSANDHTHEHLDDLADIVTTLNNGVTGTKTLAGYTFTFNHGVLTNFEEP